MGLLKMAIHPAQIAIIQRDFFTLAGIHCQGSRDRRRF